MAKTLVRNLVSWVSLTGALCCGAAQVTSDEARTAVGNWLTYRPQLGCRLGTSVAGARTCTTTNGVSFHVVNLAGGGFVVMSADTEQEPVVAFSPSDDLVESGENPLWAMLCRDFAGQAKAARLSHASAAGVTGSAVTPSERKWARLLPAKSTSGVARLQHAVTGKETISDVRVAPLLATRWSQEQDSYYSNMGDPCYNYYTPEHYPCGCVATATAQLMRYHRFPTASVTPGTYACSVMTGKDWISSTSYYPIYSERKLTMKGGTYDWDSMPLVPADGTTLAQRQAIGKLTSDIGISCLMAYGEGGSSAAAYMAARCLPDRFGYANAVAACSDRNLPADLVRRAFQSSLNAKLPVIVGLSGATGGHAVVADGYGYSMSTLYVHFNFGWAGRDDAWYAPPNLAEYSSIDALVYNIYPTGAKGGVICSGRVTDADGEPMSGAVVSVRGDSAATAMTDSLGIYSFVLSPGTYTVASGNASKSVTLKANTGTKVNDSGSYVVSTPQVSNLCDVDLVVTGEAPVVTTYKVTFVLGAHGTRTGGGALTQTVEDGNAAVAPTFTVADGWEFTGWDKSFDRVTGNLTVTAQYEEVVPLTVYEDLDEARDAATRDGKLIFLLSGATWCGYTLQLQQYIADAGSAFADNYVYLWHDQDEDPFGIAETSSVPEFWIFQPSEFSLETKDAWDETALYVCRGCPMKYEYFLSAIEWYAESRPAKGITVSLDANGGDVSASSIVRTPGAAFGALPEPVRAGYAFVGWFTAPNGGTRVTATSIVSSSVTRLYAQWLAEPEMHTVTFVLGAHGTRTGGGALTQTVEDGNAAVAPTFTVADGWEFAGWDMAFDRVTGNLTVTAQYEEGVPIEEPEDPEEPDVWRAGEAGEIAAPETTLTGKIGWSAKNLPKGLKIDAKTGVISGTPTAPGSYVVKVTAKSGAASETFDVEVTIGHYVDEMLPLEGVYEALVGVKTLVELGGNFAGCKATGLPSGLKFAAKDVNDKDFGAVPAGTVYGVPSKACTNVVVFTYKEGKVTRTASATFAVAGIPAWSVGTFNGRLDDGTGSATLTVAAGGKVSGKVVAGGMTWAFSSSGYETAVRDEDAGGEVTELSIEATAKSGTQTVDVALTVRCNGVTGDLAVGDIGATMTLWRNAWKDRGATDRLKEYVGLYTVQLDGNDSGTGYLSLSVDAKGTCKAAGKIPDGTSASGTLPLVWLEPESGAEEEGRLMAVWQMAPSAYKGGCVGGLLTWGGMRPVSSATDTEVGPPAVTGEDIAWVSKAPTASGEYGEGFERTLSANGAYYNKLAALYDYYTTLAFGAESPMLDATVKTTDYDDDDKKTTVSETIEVGAVEPACWGALTVSLDTKRAAFVVDQGKATKPVQDTETKEWSYEGENDAALTLSFTKATGVFKGSFTCWYDYVSATDNTKEPAKETLTHTSKKVSYEGVMVLGEPLRGFYLWDRTGTYEDEKTGKEKTFKYKESRPVFFE